MIVVGVDEVGRGSWAGPLCMAAVAFTDTIFMKDLDDSKKLTREKREILALEIRYTALAIGIGWVLPKRLDKIGMSAALREAAAIALSQITIDYHEIIIDGLVAFSKDSRVRVLPKADSLVPAVSAASVIAKVSRDNYMRSQALRYPGYQFERHVGYGTLLHRQALAEHGPCDIHRFSFAPLRELTT